METQRLRRALSLPGRLTRRALLWGVAVYRRYFSFVLGGHCRFVPSCSCYAEEALQRKPLFVAIGLIVWRLLRCQPLCRGGFDPVPEDRGEKSQKL